MGMHAAFSAGLPEDEVVCHVVTLDALVGWALIKRSIPLRNVRVAGVMPQVKAPHDGQIGAKALHCRGVYNVC